MLRFNRLFWKIFFAFWLASFGVILATVAVVGGIIERDSVRDTLEYKARLQAENMISRYEGGLSSNHRYDDGDDDERTERRRRHPRILPLQIYDASGRLIFGAAPRTQQSDQLAFELTSERGIAYQVRLPLDPVRSHLARLQSFLLSVQAVFVLIAATLASLLLTLIVVRPVNRLKGYVNQLHSGEEPVSIDPLLLKRGDEIGDLAREFDQMARYVELTLQSQQRLVQDVSHELRAPLARMQVAAGLAEQKLGSDSKISQRIDLECQRLSRLIDEMLSMARLNNLDATQGTFNLVELLQQAIDDLLFTQPERPVSWTPVLETQGVYQGNPELFSRAINNLFNNIIKHTDSDCPVDVVIRESNSHYEIVISDHGKGVSKETLSCLFEPFYRHNNDTNGYGLGLSIAKRAIERLNGTIAAENYPEGGLSIRIHLPMNTCK